MTETANSDAGQGAEVNAYEWALARIRERTEPEPDGLQDNDSNLWTGVRRLKADASKTDLLDAGETSLNIFADGGADD